MGCPESTEIRLRILEMAYSGQTVHIPSAFSIVEILKVVYSTFRIAISARAVQEGQHLFVLSKGHGVMALYAILEAQGVLREDQVDDYFKNDSDLPGLAESATPGVMANSGSLGMGIGVAVGLAYGSSLQGHSERRVFCLVGDGELNEGSTYEALRFAGHAKLANFALILDRNDLQAMGRTDEVLGIKDYEAFFESLGFGVLSVDGHDELQLQQALKTRFSDRPLAVIAKTVKGKGVSFMEGDNSWHYRRLDSSTFEMASLEVGFK